MALIAIGKVGKPRGLRGAFFVVGRSSEISESVRVWFLTQSQETPAPSSHTFRYQVNSCTNQGTHVIATLEGVDSREKAEALVGMYIWADRSLLPESDILWSDLENRTVMDADGELIGTVTGMYNFGAGDVVEIESNYGNKIKKMYLSLVEFDVDSLKQNQSQSLKLKQPQYEYKEYWS